jgi:hypothetical protein
MTMTARIGRTYSRTEEGKAANQAAAHFPKGTDRRMLFVERRARLRDRLGTAFLVLAWAAAIVGLIATFWSIL